MTLTLTNSESQTWQRCRRKWWLAHYRKLGRDESLTVNTAASIGNAYHAALEVYYRDGTNPLAFTADYYARSVDSIVNFAAPLEVDTLLAELGKEQALVTIMLEGYLQYLEEEGVDENLDVIGSEEEVRETLVEGIDLQGKIDVRVRYHMNPNILLQMDHKTVGDLTTLPKGAKANQQFLTYDLLAFLRNQRTGEGERTDGVVINMARRVKRTARAKPPFYGRYEVRHNMDELRNHWKHVVAIGREIELAHVRLDSGESPHVVTPPHPSKDCSWDCPFAGACLSGMFDDGSDVEGFLAANFTVIDPLQRYNKDKVVERT